MGKRLFVSLFVCFLPFFATVYRKLSVSTNFYCKNHRHLLSAWGMPRAVFRASYMLSKYITEPHSNPLKLVVIPDLKMRELRPPE